MMSGIMLLLWTFWLLRTLWTLPTTAVGLALAGLSTLFGARWQARRGVLECHGRAIAWAMESPPWARGRIFLAITFGDVILGRSAAALDVARDHEHVHVRQAHRWGPAFIPAYLLASLCVKLRGGDAYRDNPFEVAAYAHDARRPAAPPSSGRGPQASAE